MGYQKRRTKHEALRLNNNNLPSGTFVSGLFSTPMFQRGSKDTVDDTIVTVWKPGLFLYIAVSLPLLLMTLLIWGLWNFGHRLKNERSDRLARKRSFRNVGCTEKEHLTVRQNAMSQGKAQGTAHVVKREIMPQLTEPANLPPAPFVYLHSSTPLHRKKTQQYVELLPSLCFSVQSSLHMACSSKHYTSVYVLSDIAEKMG
jgi:hypothetical protein